MYVSKRVSKNLTILGWLENNKSRHNTSTPLVLGEHCTKVHIPFHVTKTSTEYDGRSQCHHEKEYGYIVILH